MTLSACSQTRAIDTSSQAFGGIYPPAAERPILVRQAPATARMLAEHNAAFERICPSGPEGGPRARPDS